MEARKATKKKGRTSAKNVTGRRGKKQVSFNKTTGKMKWILEAVR